VTRIPRISRGSHIVIKANIKSTVNIPFDYSLYMCYCCHAWLGQHCCIFTVAMLGLDLSVVYLLLSCLVWTTMWYIYCCHTWFGQQCGILTVVMLGLDNNVIYNTEVQTKHGYSKYTTVLSKPSMATINIPHCCPN
jgi:hypothetical protein